MSGRQKTTNSPRHPEVLAQLRAIGMGNSAWREPRRATAAELLAASFEARATHFRAQRSPAECASASESDSKVIPMFPGLCETTGEEADAGDQDPGLGAGDGRLEVLGQAAVAAEPGEGAFDHPSLRLGFEGPDTLGP